MKSLLLFFLFPLSSLAQTPPVRCQEVYRSESPTTSSMMDDSGFINLFGRPARTSKVEISPWLSLEALKKLSAHAKKKVRFEEWPEPVLQKLFALKDLSKSELENLTPEHQLQILSTFGQWNLLVPEGFFVRLQEQMTKTLDQWQTNDFLQWALFRKTSPQIFSDSLMTPLRSKALRDFDSMDLNTKMEFLGAELLHGGGWNFRETQSLLNQTSMALSHESGVLSLKPVKELYRSLVFLRAHQTSFFYLEILRLEQQLEIQLNRQGLSLDQGGRSGSKNGLGPLDPWFERLISRIDELFPNQEKLFEVVDPAQWGFYDPVDLYYPNLRLVVEWDGPSHYFRSLDAFGGIDPFVITLRPLDQAKDKNLQRLGISILRWSKKRNFELDTADIEKLILEQNPNTWLGFSE